MYYADSSAVHNYTIVKVSDTMRLSVSIVDN